MHFLNLENKNILILGFGVEGKSAFRAIKKKFPDTPVSIADKEEKEIPIGLVPHETFFGSNYLSILENFDVVIKSPGIVWFDEILRAHKKGILTSATNIFFDTAGAKKIIGVTGSKGKTTVATLLYEVLKTVHKNVHLIGNVGNCALDYINEDSDDALFVYELSSYQLEGLEKSPHIAVWTTIFPSHLSYHGSMERYTHAKARIAQFQTKNDLFVYNAHYHELSDVARLTKGTRMPYNHPDSYWLSGDDVFFKDTKLFSLQEVQLLGTHNKENMLAVIAVARYMSVDDEAIQKTFISFKALPHRLEYVGNFLGIDMYNDSIAVAPEATLCALEVFGSRLGTIILGGVDNDHNFSKLAQLLFSYKVKNIILLGQNRKKIYDELIKQKVFYEKEKMYEPNIFLVDTDHGEVAMKEAVRLSFIHTEKSTLGLSGLKAGACSGLTLSDASLAPSNVSTLGLSGLKAGACSGLTLSDASLAPSNVSKVCLLSPASQSFGLFKNFEERGNLFKQYIRQLMTNV